MAFPRFPRLPLTQKKVVFPRRVVAKFPSFAMNARIDTNYFLLFPQKYFPEGYIKGVEDRLRGHKPCGKIESLAGKDGRDG